MAKRENPITLEPDPEENYAPMEEHEEKAEMHEKRNIGHRHKEYR